VSKKSFEIYSISLKMSTICLHLFRVFEDLDKPLGSGAFGVVLKGRISNNSVAVKTTRDGVEKVYLAALIQELKVLSYLGSHENIVNMLGAYTSQLRQGFAEFFLRFRCVLKIKFV